MASNIAAPPPGFKRTNLVDDGLRVISSIHRYLRILRVINQIARILLVTGEQILHQLGSGVLVILPMDAARRTHIQKKANHHRLAAFARKELNRLRLIFFKDLEIFLFEIRHKPPLVVRHGHRNDDFIDRNPYRASCLRLFPRRVFRPGWAVP